MDAVLRLRAPLIFVTIAAGVYAAAFYIRGVLPTANSPEILAAALAVDMVVLVPVAYYFLVVRRLGLPAVSVIAVTVLSLVAATLIIPSQRIVAPLEIAAVFLEVGVLGFIAWKAALGVRRFRAAAAGQDEDDAFNAIRAAAEATVGSPRVADILAYELAVIYYGLFSMRRRPLEGAGRYTSYKCSALGSTLAGIGVMLTAELVAVHFLVQHYWSTTGAWILSILTAYTGIWLLSEWHAHRLRPTLITADALVLRAGLRWEVEVPFAQIASFRRVSGMEDKPRGVLNLAAFGDAMFEVAMESPVDARGIYGFRRSVRCVWFAVDGPQRFQEELSAHLGG